MKPNNETLPLISVVVIGYNAKNDIERCLVSIINQTYKNIEIIMVDDGSTDSTAEIVKEMADKDSRIKLIKQKNGGILSARKTGLKEANGVFVSFVDSDDWIKDDMIEKLAFVFNNNDIDIAISDNINVFGKREEICKNNKCKFNYLYNNYDYLELVLKQKVVHNVFGKLYKKDFLLDSGYLDLEDVSMGEDILAQIVLSINKPNVMVIDDNLYYYVQDDSSYSHNNSTKIFELVKVLNIIESRIKENNLFNKYSNEIELLWFIICYYYYVIQLSERSYSHKKYFYDSWKKKKVKDNVLINEYINKLSKIDRILVHLYNMNFTVGFVSNRIIIKLKKIFSLLKRFVKGELDLKGKKIILYNKYKAKTLKRPNGKSNFVIIGTPDTANLGDHLITEAEFEFLKKYFPKTNIMEVTGDYIRCAGEYLTNKINKEDILIITGGGFIGSLWMSEEEMIRKTIKMYPQNKIVIFPQTVFFEETEEGQRQFRKTYDIYENHPNLYICAREKKSYVFFEENMKNTYKQCLLLPDIATFYHYNKKKNKKKNNVLWCMRKDKEMIISEEEKKEILNYLLYKKQNIIKTDTVIKKQVKSIKRKKELEKKLNQFSEAKLVVTDRLHGMIMAAITGTPCIAFNNKTDKVIGVYKWIENLDYIVCVNDSKDIRKYIDKFINNNEEYIYDNSYLNKYYDKLAKLLENLLNERR